MRLPDALGCRLRLSRKSDLESVSFATFFFRKAALTTELPITARDPPFRGAGSHHLKRLVYGGLGLTLSEKAEGLEGSEWLLVGIGAIIIKELGGQSLRSRSDQ